MKIKPIKVLIKPMLAFAISFAPGISQANETDRYSPIIGIPYGNAAISHENASKWWQEHGEKDYLSLVAPSRQYQKISSGRKILIADPDDINCRSSRPAYTDYNSIYLCLEVWIVFSQSAKIISAARESELPIVVEVQDIYSRSQITVDGELESSIRNSLLYWKGKIATNSERGMICNAISIEIFKENCWKEINKNNSAQQMLPLASAALIKLDDSFSKKEVHDIYYDYLKYEYAKFISKTAFIIAHEEAHIYLNHQNENIGEIELEIESDRIAKKIIDESMDYFRNNTTEAEIATPPEGGTLILGAISEDSRFFRDAEFSLDNISVRHLPCQVKQNINLLRTLGDDSPNASFLLRPEAHPEFSALNFKHMLYSKSDVFYRHDNLKIISFFDKFKPQFYKLLIFLSAHDINKIENYAASGQIKGIEDIRKLMSVKINQYSLNAELIRRLESTAYIDPVLYENFARQEIEHQIITMEYDAKLNFGENYETVDLTTCHQ